APVPQAQRASPGRFGLPPALLDSALHALTFGVLEGATAGWLPFSWNGVRLYASGAPALRIRLKQVGQDAVEITAADAAGQPVASMRSLVLRPVSEEQGHASRSGGHHEELFRMEWPALPQRAVQSGAAAGWAVVGDGAADWAACGITRSVADLAALAEEVAAGATLPDMVLAPVAVEPGWDRDEAAAVRKATGQALALVQGWLAQERFTGAKLVLVTRGGVSVSPGAGIPDLAHAPVWGLGRSAQTENPDRIVLVDLDVHPASQAALVAAVGSGEPQLALRDGEAYAARLARLRRAQQSRTPDWARPGTVLITGGTGAIGGHIARHLA